MMMAVQCAVFSHPLQMNMNMNADGVMAYGLLRVLLLF